MWEIFLARRSQGTWGVPANHKLPNQKFADIDQLFYRMYTF
jgi:hypothetical protein